MPATQPRQFRLSDADLAMIDAIGKAWGPVKPLSRTDVIRELVIRETNRQKKTAKKSQLAH